MRRARRDIEMRMLTRVCKTEIHIVTEYVHTAFCFISSQHYAECVEGRGHDPLSNYYESYFINEE